MKKKILILAQYLTMIICLGLYIQYSYKKKLPLVRVVSDPQNAFKYDIQYISKDKVHFDNEIKAILKDVNDALKVDIPQSDVYNFNKHNCTPYILKYPYTAQVLNICKDVYFYSAGLIDPTIEVFLKKIRDTENIIKTKDIMKTQYENLFFESKPYIGFDYLMVNNNRLKKLKRGVCLNLNSMIHACQIKNLAELLKSKSIKDFYIILNNETIINGYRKNKTPWNVTYSVPVEINQKKEDPDDEKSRKIVNKNLKIKLNLGDKSISVINNTERPSSLENFYVDDLKEFKKCEREIALYIKRCRFIFYKNYFKLDTNSDISWLDNLNRYNKFLSKYLDKQNTNNIIESEAILKTYKWEDTLNVIKNCHRDSEIGFQSPTTIKFQNRTKDLVIDSELSKIFNERIKMNTSKDFSIVSDQKEKKIINEIKNEDIKNIFWNHKTWEFFSPQYIIAFIFSDNAILSRSLSLACTMNNFETADDIFDKFEGHDCGYFVLFYDEEKNIQYKSSKYLNVKIDDYKYSISL